MANLPLNSFGGHFVAGGATNLNYGVFAEGGKGCHPAPGVPPSLTNCPNAAGFFNGDVGVVNGIFSASDSFLKDSVQSITNASSVLGQLNPVSYNFKTQAFPSMRFSLERHFGLIAEDVFQIIPEIVRGFSEPQVKDTAGVVVIPQVDFQAINYTALIPFLIAGFNEQQQQIDSLINVIAQLSNPSPKQNPNNDIQQKSGAIQVELNNVSKVIQLFQNDPNPFHEQTTINFFIPDNVGTAAIWFIDNNGTVLLKVPINEHGEGSMIVMGTNLTSGIYSYSLLADGKIIETKKMVKIK